MTVEVRDGRSTRWDPHRRERRAAIIAAAITAIEEHGPDALTGQIAEKAGVPRTHVYRHFEGKHALDLAVARFAAAQISESIRAGLASGGSAFDIIRAAIDSHLAWIEQHPNLYRFLAQHAYAMDSRPSSCDDAKAALASELTELLSGYMRHFDLDPAPAERVIVEVVGMVDNTAAWWLEKRMPPREQLTTTLTEDVWTLLDRTLRPLGLALDPREPLPVLGVAAES
jgi:AcrR family transcriptional regulator